MFESVWLKKNDHFLFIRSCIHLWELLLKRYSGLCYIIAIYNRMQAFYSKNPISNQTMFNVLWYDNCLCLEWEWLLFAIKWTGAFSDLVNVACVLNIENVFLFYNCIGLYMYLLSGVTVTAERQNEKWWLTEYCMQLWCCACLTSCCPVVSTFYIQNGWKNNNFWL